MDPDAEARRYEGYAEDWTEGRDALEARLFAFLSRKYVQRSDDRQRDMGLQYMEAETHDLARTIAAFVAGAQ